MAARVPFVGSWLVGLLLGGPLSRARHCPVLHLPRVRGARTPDRRPCWCSPPGGQGRDQRWPMPGRLVSRKTYLERYRRLTTRMVCPSCPMRSAGSVFGRARHPCGHSFCAAVFRPVRPVGPAGSKADRHRAQARRLLPLDVRRAGPASRGARDPLNLIVPGIAIAGAAAPAFISAPEKRAGSVGLSPCSSWCFLASGFIASPGWPPATLVALHDRMEWNGRCRRGCCTGRTPLRGSGRPGVQNKQCRNCHALRRGRRRPGTPARQVAVVS